MLPEQPAMTDAPTTATTARREALVLTDLRLDARTVRTAAVRGELLLEPSDRLWSCSRRRLPKLVTRSGWLVRHVQPVCR
jgi:hypothetical protein